MPSSVATSIWLKAAKAATKVLTPPQLRHNAFGLIRRRAVFGDVPQADESLMIELRRRFKPEVAALSEYLDRDLLALWGYGDVAARR